MTVFGPTLRRIVEPPVEPVTLTEAKAHCRVDISDDDDYITGLIKAARSYCEEWTRTSFVEQTWRYKADYFNDGGIYLPRPPIIAINSITYIDSDGANTQLTSDLYQVDTDSIPARLWPAWGEYWPYARYQFGAVQIEYRAGYRPAGSPVDAETVPADIKHAIKLMVGHMYENREAVVMGTTAMELPLAVEALLAPYRVYTF